MLDVIEFLKKFLERPSVTPDDAGCQEILAQHLAKMDFKIENFNFKNTKNLWAKRGTQSPLLVFVGHTDVVPPGPLDQWISPPFAPAIREGYLYGRGAADMKGSLAAMLIACENFIHQHPQHCGSIAWLITSDEEGAGIDGTKKVVEILQNRQEKIAWCLVGEPTSDQQLGDTLKIGRRGSLSGKLKVFGRQGHIAYPHLADNPIHKAIPALAELLTIRWDEGNAYFQPTSLQFSNMNSGTGVGNVIPGDLELQFNFRYSPEVSAATLQAQVEKLLTKFSLDYLLEWDHSGQAFLTEPSSLVTACSAAIQKITGIQPTLSTSGGTSDGRFFATMGCQIVEFGPRNNTIHQLNECVAVEDLKNLAVIYQTILENLFILG